ncbi:glutathione S-transferase family protein [Parasphingopyxis sp. GrpM-11]|uniref:Glutathione S-transferase family protein n=2 Tax=Parasphingopyxis marina TaxID=2761622 RepID=A0A842HZH3_9SPHN|nr:glutathione S-transferase family protein [Parasphingopyxis marina]
MPISNPVITTVAPVPPFAQGLVRDLRVRWALEEASVAYDTELLEHPNIKTDEYRQRQPFGQVPVYRDAAVTLFESGAIVLYIAEQTGTLLPADAGARARAIGWMFAALNSVEPYVQQIATVDVFAADEEWAKLRRPGVVAEIEAKLGEVAAALGDKEYLEGEFTAGDLLMSTVLRIPRHTEILSGFPTLEAYKARCEARPAFERALDAHMAAFD